MAENTFNMENSSGLARIIGTYKTLSDTVGVLLNSSGAAYVEIIPPYPSEIVVQGGGGQESTVITTETRDGNGNLVEKILEPGDVSHYPPGAIHQEEALEDCYIIEASTNHFNDRVRCEELYNVEYVDGLPTTSEEEIIEK